jgi:hypothetical protein
MTQQRRISLTDVRGIALVGVALAAFGGGAAIAAISQGDAARPAAWDEHVQWQSVGQGQDANFGRYQIFRMPDGVAPGGQACFGISLPDQDLPGVARAIAAGCGTDATLGVAFMRGNTGTLAYGFTSGNAESVTLDGAGHGPRQGRVISGPGEKKYFVVSSPDRLAQAHLRAVDAQGKTTAEETSQD